MNSDIKHYIKYCLDNKLTKSDIADNGSRDFFIPRDRVKSYIPTVARIYKINLDHTFLMRRFIIDNGISSELDYKQFSDYCVKQFIAEGKRLRFWESVELARDLLADSYKTKE